MTVIVFIVILSFLVIIHELGHFFAARWSGMTVEEFGLGYPPRAKSLFTWKGTIFSLNWVPFGGFVKIKGEDEAGGEFTRKPVWKRLIVILAGATTNFIFGIIAFAVIFSKTGIPVSLNQARIGQVAPDSPAAESGLPEQVTITEIVSGDERIEVESTDDVIDAVQQHQGETITLNTTGSCDPDGFSCTDEEHSYQAYVRTEEETPQGEGSLGVVFQTTVYQFYPWYEMPFRAIWYGLVQALWLGQLILVSLGDLVGGLFVNGSISQDVAGPVGIVHQASSSGIFAEGFLAILSFTGMLSINLAIMNVLPIPALDGGRALFISLEKIVGRKRIEKVEEYANFVGYFFLLGLIILITVKDIVDIVL